MTGRLWPVADAQYRRILHANAILQRIKAVEVCGIKTRQANSKDRRRTPENPKGDLSGRLFPCSPSTGKSEAPRFSRVSRSDQAAERMGWCPVEFGDTPEMTDLNLTYLHAAPLCIGIRGLSNVLYPDRSFPIVLRATKASPSSCKYELTSVAVGSNLNRDQTVRINVTKDGVRRR